MGGQHETGRARGIERVWRLVGEGYRIADVDSDDLFVGVRMRRGGESVTLLLTREDFVLLFPNAPPALVSVGDDGDDVPYG